MFQLSLFKLLTSFDDEMDQIKEAEQVSKLFKSIILLTLSGLIIYLWLGYLGVGSQLILDSQYQFAPEIYESNKFWFIVGRGMLAIILMIATLFIPALIFKWLFSDLPLSKLIIMQIGVFAILLIERLTWIPLVTIFSLDWYVSPFSLGVLASYVTTKSWLIYFFGSISLFHIIIIGFQIKFLTKLSNHNRAPIYVSVVFLNFSLWWLIALLTFISPYIIEGWF